MSTCVAFIIWELVVNPVTLCHLNMPNRSWIYCYKQTVLLKTKPRLSRNTEICMFGITIPFCIDLVCRLLVNIVIVSHKTVNNHLFSYSQSFNNRGLKYLKEGKTQKPKGFPCFSTQTFVVFKCSFLLAKMHFPPSKFGVC